MHTLLCRRLILLQIVRALRKSAHVTENVKNVSSITQRKAKSPTVQDNRLKNHVFSEKQKIVAFKVAKSRRFGHGTNGDITR